MRNSPNELKEILSLAGLDNFENITNLTDVKCGISLQKRYPNDIRYKPPKKKNKDPDTYALIKIIHRHPDDKFLPAEKNSRMPIYVSITCFSRYIVDHFDYDFEDGNCPTRISIEESKTSPKPINLNYPDDFYYDHSLKSFIDNKNNKISGTDIINKVFKEHCNTVHITKGFVLRSKLNIRSISISLCNLTVNLLIKSLQGIFGWTLDSDPIMANYYGYERKDLKRLKTEYIEIFGYKTGSKIIIIFCVISIMFYLMYWYYNLNIPYIRTIFSNNLLTLTHSIFTLWVLDFALPRLIFNAINMLIKLKIQLITSKIKTS
ncbi:MAG: hypothetical protein ACUZ8E_01430 [Candidatus Anammoxibacter sp.]